MTDYSPLDRDRMMVRLLASTGVGASFLELCYDMCPALPDLDADTRRYTFGPIVYHNAGHWTDPAFVKEWQGQIFSERLDILFDQIPGHRVSPTEIMVVAHDASMSSPLHHDLTELYLWASKAAVIARWGAERGPDFIASIPSPHATDDDFLKSGGRFRQVYVDLAGAIRSPSPHATDDDFLKSGGRFRQVYVDLAGAIRSKVIKASQASGKRFDLAKRALAGKVVA
jgi:hypothetical protein